MPSLLSRSGTSWSSPPPLLPACLTEPCRHGVTHSRPLPLPRSGRCRRRPPWTRRLLLTRSELLWRGAGLPLRLCPLARTFRPLPRRRGLLPRMLLRWQEIWCRLAPSAGSWLLAVIGGSLAARASFLQFRRLRRPSRRSPATAASGRPWPPLLRRRSSCAPRCSCSGRRTLACSLFLAAPRAGHLLGHGGVARPALAWAVGASLPSTLIAFSPLRFPRLSASLPPPFSSLGGAVFCALGPSLRLHPWPPLYRWPGAFRALPPVPRLR